MDGYCSDFGRSLYFGPAPTHIREAYKALQQAVLDAVASIQPSVTRVCDLYPAVEHTLDSLGYGDFLRARLRDKVLGHCIGQTVHEDPWLRPDCDTPLAPGRSSPSSPSSGTPASITSASRTSSSSASGGPSS